jgi:diguanylate cyclase (GGDEF)-like protein
LLPGFAQRYSFRGINTGLGNLTANCIAQDARGYLWIGTENGLYRYNGRRFRTFGSADGLTARAITSLFASPDGTLWVGTNAGLFFERNDESFVQISAPAPFHQFSAPIGSAFTAPAPDRVVYADASGAFLLRHIEPNLWSAEPMHLEATSVWSVLSAPDGSLWFGCDQDLCHKVGPVTTRIQAPPGSPAERLPAERWSRLLLAANGNIWMRGPHHLGEYSPRDGHFSLRDLPGSSHNLPYPSLLQDRQGRIVSTQGPALGFWENDHWHMIDQVNGLTGFEISTLFLDRENTLWIASIGHGLKRWDGQERWEGYMKANGLSNNTVWAPLVDRQGRLWVGTEAGLDWKQPDSNRLQAWSAPGVEPAPVETLAESPDGAVWMAIGDESLVRIDPRSLAGKVWKLHQVRRIVADPSRQLWIATMDGLFVMDLTVANPQPRRVQDAAILDPHEPFRDLCLDDHGQLWVASSQGLLRRDEQGWHRIDSGLAPIQPFQIALDRQGNLWGAGAFTGLARLTIVADRVQEAQRILPPQLLSEQVVSLLVDHRGWLWVGQDAGLSVFDGHNWRSYTQNDGMIWNDLDSLGLAEDHDGSLWIGTSGGLSHLLRPEAVAAQAPSSPILSRMVFGKTHVAEGSVLDWQNSTLSVSLDELDFSTVHSIRFRYQLVGADPDWVEMSDTTIRYPRLAPGKYRFRVMAVDASTGTVSSTTEIGFRIVPRWWQDWRVWGGGVVFVLLVPLWVLRTPIRWPVRTRQRIENAVQLRTQALQSELIELQHSREQMRHFAEHDELTGLWNHRVILDRLRGEVDRCQRDPLPLSILLVDLDQFQRVNDKFGKLAGDQALREVSALLARSVRSYDWVGRYGGEEFLLVLPGTDLASAQERAEQLRSLIEQMRLSSVDPVLGLTASIGIASGTPAHYEAMIHSAEKALYEAKDQGHNSIQALLIESSGSFNAFRQE